MTDCFFSDKEYSFLEKLVKFPIRKDKKRHRFGKIITEKELSIVENLETMGYVVEGIHQEKDRIYPTASITNLGEWKYNLDKKYRRIEHNKFWKFIYR